MRAMNTLTKLRISEVSSNTSYILVVLFIYFVLSMFQSKEIAMRFSLK